MKTLQKWLLEANVEAVIGTILYENPINLTMLEDKRRSVAEILDTAKAKLCCLIKYLLSLTAVQSKDGVFFASKTREEKYPEVYAVLSTCEEIMKNELPQSYGWEFTPWEEIIGYRIAETKLTIDHANAVLAYILYRMTDLGMDHETWKQHAAEIEESLREAERDSKNGVFYSVEEAFAQFGLPQDEPDKIADELNHKITLAELEYSQHCLKREAAKVRRLLLSEYNNQSFCSEL